MKKVSEGFEVVVKNNGEQIDGIDYPALEEFSNLLDCMGEADGSFDFGRNISNAMNFSKFAIQEGFTTEIFKVEVFDNGNVFWLSLTQSMVAEYLVA